MLLRHCHTSRLIRILSIISQSHLLKRKTQEVSMKINIKDLNINQNSWNCGMQTIAEAIIAEVYKVDRKSIPFVSADFNQLKFKGINPRNFDEYFEIDLKIVPKLRFISKKKEDLNGKEKMAADIGADRKM